MLTNRKGIWSNIGYWLGETIIVFVGVYLAFLLNSYRTKIQKEQKRQQIYTALYRNFSGFKSDIKRNINITDSLFVKPFLKEYQSKKMPRLKKWPFIKFGTSDNTWNAILQSGGINLLSVHFIQEVSHYYAALERLHQISDHFNRMSDKYLLPNYNANIHEFYNPKTKKLRKRYEWYLNYLKKQRNYQTNMLVRANRIVKMLKGKISKKQLQKIKKDSIR